jgi:acetyl-CoA synthetase
VTAHEAVDRHALGPRANHLALRWLGRDGTVRDFTYRELSEASNRFANVLDELGVPPGDTVFVLAGRIPELYIAVLGALKRGCVVSPLFSAFGPEPIRTRMTIGAGRVLVTTTSLYRKKIAPIRPDLPALKHVLIVHDEPDNELPLHTMELRTLMGWSPTTFDVRHTRPEEPALLHFTSGTTGRPKGAVHVHGAVVAHAITGRLALDLHEDDVFWCTADPGWVTGTSYGIVAPLVNGATMIVDEADFDAARWYDILRDQNVSVWYTAPTACG